MQLLLTTLIFALGIQRVWTIPHPITKKATLPEPSLIPKRQFLDERLDSWSIDQSKCSSKFSISGIGALNSALQNPPSTLTFDYISWCSWFLMTTVYAYEFSSTTTVTAYLGASSIFTTETSVQTSTDSHHTTATLLCAPTPSSQPAICSQYGAGLWVNMIHDYSQIIYDATSCQQLCLRARNCKSFQLGVGAWAGWCFGFDKPIYGYAMNLTDDDGAHIGNGFPSNIMWDRTCQDVNPAGCKKSQHHSRQASPRPLVKEVARRGNLEPLPTWLEQYDQYDAWDVCSCAITSASPTFTYTYPAVDVFWSVDLVTVTTTEVSQTTVTPFVKTIYQTAA